ncbi:UDP-glucosyltransferase 29-like [Populus alba]|uniref:UDP-glucosyltransferase 29-like n=1 Tax=Populus alba TaxID=43335 RepID=UPI003CC6DF2C
MASSSFSSILTKLRPDFLICDFFQPWAPALALSLNIPTVQFVVSGNKANSVAVHAFKKSGVVVQDSAKDFLFIKDRILQHLEQSSGVMLVRSLREIEGKYLDDLSAVTMKRVFENYLSKEDREELALGLFLSNVNITRVLRFPRGTGEHLRKKARELSDCIRDRAGQEIDEVVNDWVHLVGRKTHNPF